MYSIYAKKISSILSSVFHFVEVSELTSRVGDDISQLNNMLMQRL